MTGHARRSAPGLALPVASSVALSVALAAGCATPAGPEGPQEVRGFSIAPYAIHEACHRLAAGERLDWRYESRMPVHFNIHYHDGPSVVMPLSRDASLGDSGIYVATVAHDYCAMWEAGPLGTVIDFAVRPIGAAR